MISFRDIERKQKVDPELFLVGVIEATVVATVMAGYEGHRGWINYLALSPDHRHQGIARRLMAEAEKLLRERGCPKINLQVRRSNVNVVRFYESLGYTVDSVVSLGKRLVEDGGWAAGPPPVETGERIGTRRDAAPMVETNGSLPRTAIVLPDGRGLRPIYYRRSLSMNQHPVRSTIAWSAASRRIWPPGGRNTSCL